MLLLFQLIINSLEMKIDPPFSYFLISFITRISNMPIYRSLIEDLYNAYLVRIGIVPFPLFVFQSLDLSMHRSSLKPYYLNNVPD